ncbi:MAG: GNAT family N-acetyltransferase [Candidatus Cryptobacteroides sp.]
MIRNADKSDIPLVADCVLAAIDLYDFKGDCAEKESTLRVCSESDSLYSYKGARIAEVDGKPAGCLISYDGAGYAVRRAKTFRMFEEMGIHISINGAETGPGEYYLDSMAVKPEYRGFRLGQLLIEDAISQARKIPSCRKVSLLVEKTKVRLKAYYAASGFRTELEMEAFGSVYEKMSLAL